MAHLAIRPDLVGLVAGIALVAVSDFAAPVATADVTAYLVNVTIRPGYNSRDADAAVAYGNGLCDMVFRGRTYAQMVEGVERDFATTDEYQASYLIEQAVNELCPAMIWQLRNSAAHFPSVTKP